MTAEEYRNNLEQDFSDVDINEMADLRMIKADRNKSLQERRVPVLLDEAGLKDAYREFYPDVLNYPGFTYPSDNPL